MRRVAVIALAAAAVFAAILGAASPAQDPVATSSPASTPTVIAPTPAASAPPAATTAPVETPAQAPTQAPVETATQAPTETATQAPTSEAPTPAASPEHTATASPAPEATGTATPGDPSEPAAAPAKGVARKSPTKKTNTEDKIVEVDKGDKCSTSSSDRDCKTKRPARDDRHEVVKIEAPKLTTATGAPAPTNPGYSLATVGPAPIGVPNFFIDKFRIPPFLLSIYQAAGMQYGVRWEVLAAINEIETDYGRNLNVSYAGALGWMQFMPATWKMYGVDANRDGEKDPYNPVDAIFAAARYLRAAGADQRPAPGDLRLQPRRLVRRLRAAARPGHRRPPQRPRRLAHRPHAGPLPRARQGHLRRQAREGRRRAPASARARTPPSWWSPTGGAAGSTSSPATARRRSPSTTARSSGSAAPSASGAS